MQIIYRKVAKVTFKDEDREFELPVDSFIEYDDDVRITSPFRDTFLKRGWVGDLTYETDGGIDLKDDCSAYAIKETLNNVLLKSVLLTHLDIDSPCSWEYVFLKK